MKKKEKKIDDIEEIKSSIRWVLGLIPDYTLPADRKHIERLKKFALTATK